MIWDIIFGVSNLIIMLAALPVNNKEIDFVYKSIKYLNIPASIYALIFFFWVMFSNTYMSKIAFDGVMSWVLPLVWLINIWVTGFSYVIKRENKLMEKLCRYNRFFVLLGYIFVFIIVFFGPFFDNNPYT